jgi:hypothetical protein
MEQLSIPNYINSFLETKIENIKMPSISSDGGITWSNASTIAKGILVIVPGAGTFQNKPTYEQLKQNYLVKYRDTDIRENGFIYPDNWTNIMKVQLPDSDEDSLRGLAKKIGNEISSKKFVPEIIIAGSRGSQVVLPLLLRFFWRGPFIAINGGPITSNTQFPKHTLPFFITCEHDYFPTKNKSFVETQFNTLSEVTGYNLRLNDHGHMPDLSSSSTVSILSNICEYLLNPTVPMKQMTTYSHNLYKLEQEKQMKTYSHKQFTPNEKIVLTVNSHKSSQINILLRKNPLSQLNKNIFQDKRDVNNGDKIQILAEATDENKYKMYNVKSLTGVEGWIYAINIKELQ